MDTVTYEWSGPVVHIGVSLVLAYLFRLNRLVTIFCGILPDMVDKSLQVFEIGGGRYVGHTLLFVGVVALAFFLWKRKYGLAALVGGLSHLVLDLNALVPWFYPFKEYDFYDEGIYLTQYLREYISISGLGVDLAIAALLGSVGLLCLWLYRRYRK